ncbi:MAG: hypothetical protein JJ850_15990 [Kordiimonadaceae bacterium]|nr:hypothetical protein [Kordiimonadaceae bacterium]MBO6569589.1 hypothetical protein [Kordiimonadaceae bacterium]MBO6966124.1 hypothetical protein [Kordiimonadaceae bacterium]
MKISSKMIAAIVVAAMSFVVIGYAAGQHFYVPERCCTPPGYLPPSVNDFVAAWSGPVAGIIAIVIAVWNNFAADRRFRQQVRVELLREKKAERRFKLQIENQNTLDQKADFRQQAEWKRRETEAVADRNVLRRSIRKGLIAELKVASEQAGNIVDEIDNDESLTNLLGLIDSINPDRPVYDQMGQNVVLLNKSVIEVITTLEPKYRYALQQAQRNIEEANKGSASPQSNMLTLHAKTCLERYIDCCKDYIKALEM